jgi:hypothetical protein
MNRAKIMRGAKQTPRINRQIPRLRSNTSHRFRQRLFSCRLSSSRAGSGLSWRDFFKVHPAADAFPLMPQDELRKPAADIEKNGLKVPIQTRAVAGESRPYLIDGRNRLDATESLGWQIIDGNGKWFGALAVVPNTLPKVEHLVGRTHADVAAEVIGYNIQRRHLTKQEQVELIQRVLRAATTDSANIAESVKHREGGKLAGSTKGFTGAVVDQAANIGISRRTVERVLAKPSRKPKPPVNKLKREYINKRFGMFLKHWQSRDEQQKVRKVLLEILNG